MSRPRKAKPKARSKHRDRRQPRWRWAGSAKAWIVGLGAIASAIGAVLALAFTLVPTLKPCFGRTTAEFKDVDAISVGPLAVDVSYTLETHGYEGKDLQVIWTLRRADARGRYRTVPGFERVPGATLVPQSCEADEGGEDISVVTTESGKYRIVLELFPPGDAARITRTTADFAAT